MALSLAAASAAGEEASWHLRSERQSSRVTQAAAAATDPLGPFQYSERGWLHALKQTGVQPALARRIFLTSTGVAYVPAAAERRQILALRHDLVIAGQVAFLQARANALALLPLLGRTPTVAELHAAHLLGASGAARLVQGAAASPAMPAQVLLAEAALEVPQSLLQRGRAVSLGDLARLFEGAEARIASSLGGIGSHRRPVVAAAQARRPAAAWVTQVRAER